MRNFQLNGRSTVHAKQGMVATSHPIAVGVGLDILKSGGNAVDAAIAMALVLPLCEPQSTGLFGDVFAMIKPQNSNEIIGLNGSGSTPKDLSANLLREKGYSVVPECGVESITLPGAVAAFESLNKKFGSISLKDLCKPAIQYAENGIVVAPRVAFDWSNSFDNLKGTAKNFYSKNGKPLKVGSIFRSKGQAEVLRKISEEGSKGFYQGEVAEDIINSLSKLGGIHTYDDLANVSVEYIEPIKEVFGDYELFEMPPNGQGVTAILMTKILQKFGISNLDPMGSERIHLEAEAAKIAYNVRDQLIGDQRFYQFDPLSFYSDEVVNKYVSEISHNKTLDIKTFKNEATHKDTVYLTVIDKDRVMVSLIFSIFNSFGSGYASEKFGLLFHNRGAGFSLKKDHPNELMGGKRPFHTIIPAFLRKENNFNMPFGVMGGQYQANGHARLISNIIDFGMDIQQAIDFPRSFPSDGFLNLEAGYSNSIAKDLEAIGHKILRPDQPIGGAQAIMYEINQNNLVGGSDPRKDGCAMGY